jgi:ankyrin repeat protein
MQKESSNWPGPGYHLSMACRNGNLNEVQKLLDEGAVVNWTNECGCAALYYACFKGHVRVVKLLLDRGAQMDIKHGEELMMASQFGHVEIVKLLLDNGAHINIQSDGGWTALMNASLFRRVECVRLLLERGADMSLKDKEGKTAKDMAKEEEAKGQANHYYHDDEQRAKIANTLQLLNEVCILQIFFNDHHS